MTNLKLNDWSHLATDEAQDHKRTEIAERPCIKSKQKQYPTKQRKMNMQFFGEATDKKQVTCTLNKKRGKIVPMQYLSTCIAAFKNKPSQPQELQRQGLLNQMKGTESILDNIVHTAILPLHARNSCWKARSWRHLSA